MNDNKERHSHEEYMKCKIKAYHVVLTNVYHELERVCVPEKYTAFNKKLLSVLADKKLDVYLDFCYEGRPDLARKVGRISEALT